MPKETITIYCINSCLDGKGGTFQPGDKFTTDSKEEAAKLLATKRFLADKEKAEAAVKRINAAKKTAPKKQAQAKE